MHYNHGKFLRQVQKSFPGTDRSAFTYFKDGRTPFAVEMVAPAVQQIMVGIYHNVANAAKEYGFGNNFEKAANVAGFMKVAEAMLAQGVC